MKKQKMITASEIGDFVYCPRCWWKRIMGISPTTPDMIRGTVAHNAQHEKLSSVRQKKVIAIIMIVFSITLVMLLIVLKIFFKIL